jgi:hypothetical protein
MANTSTETLIRLAEYLTKQGYPVPVDIQSRLLAAGIDIRNFN